jgi:D-arginine dehydrogenase
MGVTNWYHKMPRRKLAMAGAMVYRGKMEHYDIAIIGAGIAGASLAARLSGKRRVIILEMEERAGYHTTGRSAAAYEPNYGPSAMLAFTRASGAFHKSPPQGFAEAPIFTPRGSLFFEAEGQEQRTAKLLHEADGLTEISEAEAQSFFPVLRKGYAKRIFRDHGTGDLDVDLLHRGFLKMAKADGGVLALNSSAKALEQAHGKWTVALSEHTITADVIVNAAGAWGDVVGELAGTAKKGLVPKRRSIAVVPVDANLKSDQWPMATDVGETWYCKPQSGKLLVSSADATPVDPHDAYADDMAIAEGIERMMNATTIEVERLEHTWGGLRSFVKDGNPVVGYDADVKNFFWLIGQGGYGIQSSPALSETAAALVMGRPTPQYILDFGLKPGDIDPNRKALS